jgi:hypothetical protein
MSGFSPVGIKVLQQGIFDPKAGTGVLSDQTLKLDSKLELEGQAWKCFQYYYSYNNDYYYYFEDYYYY